MHSGNKTWVAQRAISGYRSTTFEAWGRSGSVENLELTKSKYVQILGLLVAGTVLGACASPTPKVATASKPKSKEYFAESEYGVKASPRVKLSTTGAMPRGGGREQVGKPYKVRGKWYYPKEEPGYSRKGRASWYGSAFHGRLTANGEVYDMRHLSAAHPTMPLPSYARVTNIANGSSVIVRVNDRGPYSGSRVIDLSQKAAEMLDYTHSGTADVKVDYVGRAPLEGRDDDYLMASFQGPGAPDPIGQPASGVMIAMDGPTPTSGGAIPLPGVMGERPIQVASLDAASAANMMIANAPASNVPLPAESGMLAEPMDVNVILPAIGPLVAEKPAQMYGILHAPTENAGSTFASSYASSRVAAANTAETALSSLLTPNMISSHWKQMSSIPETVEDQAEYVDVGYYKTKEEADRVLAALSRYGKATVAQIPGDDGDLFNVTATAASGNTDELLQAAWKVGARDAFVVRSN